MRTLKLGMVFVFSTMLLLANTHVVYAQTFAPKKLDSDIIANAKDAYNKSVSSTKKNL